MNKLERVNQILNLKEVDYKCGRASKYINYKTLEELYTVDGISLMSGRKTNAPMQEIYNFMEKYSNKQIEVRVDVVLDKKEEVKIEFQTLAISSQYAKLRTEDDILFWKEFMSFERMNNPYLGENKEWISWGWYN